MPVNHRWSLLGLAVVPLISACAGAIGPAAQEPPAAGRSGSSPGPSATGNGGIGSAGPGAPRPALPDDQAPASALARLSRRELDNTVADLFGASGMAAKHLPPDKLDPFDTARENGDASSVFVEGSEALAYDLAQQVAGNSALTQRLAGCVPARATDQACLESFVRGAGRLMWRRPLDATLLTTTTSFRSRTTGGGSSPRDDPAKAARACAASAAAARGVITS